MIIIRGSKTPAGAFEPLFHRGHKEKQQLRLLSSPGVELLQRTFFQPAYLCLTDADLLRYLHLRFAAQISQLHNALFPGRKGGYRIAELQPTDPALLDRKSTRLNSSHKVQSRMPSSA